MTRFVLITFALLGWTFYVMSGGPDFEPRGLRADQPERVAAAPKPAPKPLTPAPVEELVTRAALKSTDAIQPLAEPAAVLGEDETKALLSQVAAGLQANPSLFDDQSVTLTLASLEQGVTALQQVTTDADTVSAEIPMLTEPEKDIREISGTRVNMRDGPGTIYPIIGKARIGQKVEVLSESGTGWLRLRVLPGQQVGWISASLVRKKTN
ncbi:SH3 domain-containing protein [Ruegeria haliotis]|nr:SH3 domain-containing protein [Ruegeria haliotis]